MRQDYTHYAHGEITDLQINNLFFNDLNIVLCGKHICDRTQSWGYGIRRYYFLHFVIEGCGEFTNQYGTFTVSKGQGFAFGPNERVFYRANNKTPWNYIWIAFSGEKVERLFNSCTFDAKNPVFDFENLFDISKIYNVAKELDIARELYLLSSIFNFFSVFNRKNIFEVSKIDMAINFIIRNYSSNITVEDVAKYIGFERKYFSRIFANKTSLSPCQYIMNTRMNVAAELLKNSKHTISEIAYSVGYNDPITFSKAFKRVYNMTPREFSKYISNKE